MVPSTASISLPSRLRSRPFGVVSKNDIGLRRIPFKPPSKMFLEAATVPIAKHREIAKLAKAENINRMYKVPYIVKH